MNNSQLRIGGHLKTSDGLAFAVSCARGLRYNIIQIMVGEGRAFEPYEFEQKAIDDFKAATYDIEKVVHLPYVINPCEDVARRRAYYLRAMRKFLAASEEIGARKVVLHPGFKKDLSEEQASKNSIEFLEQAWDGFELELALETDSGSKNGSAVGSTDFIVDQISNLTFTVSICIDTVHLFARGLNLWDDEIRKVFLSEYEKYISLVHLNSPDPKVQLGNNLDRHSTPFESRKELDPTGMIKDLSRWPLILERRSLAVQQQDNVYVRKILGQPLEKQKA